MNLKKTDWEALDNQADNRADNREDNRADNRADNPIHTQSCKSIVVDQSLLAAMLDPCPLGPNMEKELEESNDLAFLLALDMWGNASQK